VTGTDEKGSTASRRRRLRTLFTSPDSYGLLLILILLTYGLSVSLHGAWGFSVILLAQMVTLWLALHTSEAHRVVRVLSTVLVLSAGVAAVFNLIQANDRVPAPVALVALLLYFLAPWVIVIHVAERHEIDAQTLLGAVSAYLLIGMFFAFTYQFLGVVQSVPFFGAQGDGRLPDYLFFSFTTLTTTGYGNLVPSGNPGQSLAVLEMIVGQLFLITAVGKIIAEWRPRRRAAAPDDPVAG
jgi:Ion channel